MIRAYKEVNDDLLYFHIWETDENKAVFYQGVMGNEGELEHVSANSSDELTDKINHKVDELNKTGWSGIDDDEYDVLIIEYKIEGDGTEAEHKKRQAVQDKMNEVLGWTGVGYCDGGSIGSGTMEICCIVFDYQLAYDIINEALNETEFADFSRIYVDSEA
jgi:hypothetical protein